MNLSAKPVRRLRRQRVRDSCKESVGRDPETRHASWALTAWQYKDPDANEPSGASYTMSRVGALVTLVVVVVFGVQATGWQAEAQTRDDCKTVLLPALRTVLGSKPVAPSALDDFARAHGLTVKTNAIRVPSYQTPRRTVSASPSPSVTGKSTKKPTVSGAASPTPTPARTTAPARPQP